ncbi:hydrolase/acyltransferase [Brevibacillus laterosporus]|uniref:Hydrolase/acyltransferase n=1 Tax=Brevibacillus laterosporus TaxID=1465 RepID=A0A502IVU8_BRELA|nr:hydrolase/acyltransferase [Brevibacillus laterosporus]QDX92372.1 hydrolase/acyltransferase [Brevibacillus laterosporus]RAP23135.1 hypothetical protein C2W64_03134 [Brevibacillus laterosporus]TPG70681.1 hydrolase/acyltransferase [Brevibacillus laterosporus]TPG91017.1 hydrolase/acyltransferase [Brevibacillus laterosporus]
MRYLLLQKNNGLFFVQMPSSHMYQLLALLKRLHKEHDKLTVVIRPELPDVLGECSDLELLSQELRIIDGLSYINELEASFSCLNETEYPLLSLLTEIRALQAQLEGLAEEE